MRILLLAGVLTLTSGTGCAAHGNWAWEKVPPNNQQLAASKIEEAHALLDDEAANREANKNARKLGMSPDYIYKLAADAALLQPETSGARLVYLRLAARNAFSAPLDDAKVETWLAKERAIRGSSKEFQTTEREWAEHIADIRRRADDEAKAVARREEQDRQEEKEWDDCMAKKDPRSWCAQELREEAERSLGIHAWCSKSGRDGGAMVVESGTWFIRVWRDDESVPADSKVWVCEGSASCPPGRGELYKPLDLIGTTLKSAGIYSCRSNAKTGIQATKQ